MVPELLLSCDPAGESSGWQQGKLGLSDSVLSPVRSDLGEAALKIVGVTLEDDGIYTCIAVNDMGSASSAASLRVLGELHPRAVGPLFQEPQVPRLPLHLTHGPSKQERQAAAHSLGPPWGG